MKKILKNMLIVLLTASMLFLLAGCGNKEESTTTNNTTNEQTTREQKVEFSMGEWNNNVYTNEFLGLKFNLPEGWTYASDEEIADMMNLGTELLNDDQKAAAEVSKLTTAYYMVANDPNTGNSISIISEKPVMEVSTEYYMNELKTQLSAVESINYEIGETSKEKIADREYDILTASASMSGVKITQKYYIYKMDRYFVGIIVTSTTGETALNEMIKSFE